jgi:hypothetical protein
MCHATALFYHVCAVASRNIRFASCGTSGKLTLWTRYVHAYPLSVGHDAAGQVQFYFCNFLSRNSIHAAIFHARFQIRKGGRDVIWNEVSGNHNGYQHYGCKVELSHQEVLGHYRNIFWIFIIQIHTNILNLRVQSARRTWGDLYKTHRRLTTNFFTYLQECHYTWLE